MLPSTPRPPACDDAVLALYLVTHALGGAAPPGHAAAFAALEARLCREPALRRRRALLERRLQALAASVEPTAQFERLTGYRL